MKAPISIISLSSVRHPWYATDRMHSFTYITANVIFLSGIEGIWCGKEAFMYGMVSKMIEGLNMGNYWASLIIIKQERSIYFFI